MYAQNLTPCEKNITKEIIQKNGKCFTYSSVQKNNKLKNSSFNQTQISKAMRYSQLLSQPNNSYCTR